MRNDVMQATGRRQVPWEHSALTAKFYFTPPKTTAQQVELEFWASVKDSTTPSVLGTYLERYPNGEFAPIARALVEHYSRQLKAELAAREEARKREEEERRAAAVKRLEEERRTREVALAEERKRAEEAKSVTDISRLDEQAKSEWRARTEELRQALEEAKLAREAAKAAEEKKLAALKEAEAATKAAEEAIAKKREADKAGDPAKVAALPKLETPQLQGGLDGVWTIVWDRGPGCGMSGGGRYIVSITQGTVMYKGGAAGRISASGTASWTAAAVTDGAPVRYQGTLRGTTGSGRFDRQDGKCSGTFTAKRG